MPEDTGNGSYASGASTPTSPNFDPGASEFVPKRTPATDGRTASGQLRAAFNTIPGLGSSSRRSARPPLPLFSTSTWSPSNDQPIRSAGVPSKPVWDGSIGRNHALNSSQSQASPSRGFNGGTPQGLFLNSPLSGRGMSSDGNGRDDRTHRAKVSPGFPTIRYEQTTEYHTSQPTPKSAPQGSFISRTDPLPQQPFFWSDREAPASSSGSNASQQAAVPSTPNSSASSFATQAFNEYNGFDDQTSPASGSVVISDHYSKTHPEQAGTKSKVWKERHHTQGLRRALKDPHADWEEAYPGALGILTCMNPETYQMPFGTRVVNIKTEYPRNILLSLKHCKYSVMEKVAQRIMGVWEARHEASEKVLFLFSVNGSKKFCGVAEMCGPWKPDDNIPNWEHNPESNPCVGTIPIVWVFVKDVNYHQFIHIKQPNNDNPVGNMWNGMNFSSETGREVMEIYVQTPPTSSILGYPRDCEENKGLPPASVFTRRGGYNSRSHRGGRGDFRGGSRGGHAFVQPWRQRNISNNHAPEDESDADQTPTGGAMSGQRQDPSRGGPPPKFDSPTREERPRNQFKPGQLLSVVVDDQGKFEIVHVDSNEQTPTGGDSRGSGLRARGAGAGSDGKRGGLHGARSLGSLHHSFSSTSTVRAQDGTSKQRLHPAASMSNIGHDQGASRRDRVSPLSATWTNIEPEQYNGLLSPEAAYGDSKGNNGAVEGTPGIGEDTPTHRPASHSSRRTGNPSAEGLKDVRPSLNSLKSRFHAVTAEQYSMQAQLDEPGMNDNSVRLLNAKIARILVQKREIQAELAMMGVHPETLSPMRHGSFSSTEPESSPSASAHQISPVRAEDGRRLRSISKLDSPLQLKDASGFDKAPGGSDRVKRHRAKESFGDMSIKKSIKDLVDSPKKSATPLRPALQTSTFFPQNVVSPCERRALSFPVPDCTSNGKPTSPNGYQTSTFSAALTNNSDKDSSTGRPDDVGSRPGAYGGVRLDS